ncbi:MFS transporter [Ochrobactrum vermis]|uniref:MFS transporter n=1 Tax=Ochrobactrum vermis TaxID=1827297 RepID=A0ABU8PKV9_9HYPH|nr:MFS transporter [Ochrobactrum vermis]
MVGGRLAEVTWFYTVTSFALAYATTALAIPRKVILDATIWGAAVAFFVMPLAGMMGDRIGHKRMFMAGAAAILIAAPAFFGLLATKEAFWINMAMILATGLVYSCLYGPEGSLFSSQFSPAVRYSGISLAVQVSGAIGGGLAPIIATWLLSLNDGDPRYVIWYLVGLSIVAFISAWRMHNAEHFTVPRPAKRGNEPSTAPAGAS